jgi:GT2 family glycosyltransferase
MSKAGITLSIIIVNWNTADLLTNCLQSIQNNVSIPNEVLVVDNGSSDLSVQQVRKLFPVYQLIELGENLGFAAANNLALSKTQGDFILLLNPDTEILFGTLETLIVFMVEQQKVGIVGPTLWYPDGKFQPSTGSFPTLQTEFLRQTMLNGLYLAMKSSGNNQNKLRRVDMVTGAALLIRRQCYSQIGPLDANIFMFYEDTDWCRRAFIKGWETWYVPCKGVIHHKAAASRSVRTRTLLDSLRGTIYYFEKHHGSHTILFLRAIALCGALARSARAAILWLFGSNRHDQCQRLLAYQKMIFWSLLGKSLD